MSILAHDTDLAVEHISLFSHDHFSPSLAAEHGIKYDFFIPRKIVDIAASTISSGSAQTDAAVHLSGRTPLPQDLPWETFPSTMAPPLGVDQLDTRHTPAKPVAGPDYSLYCERHEVLGHRTRDCRLLKAIRVAVVPPGHKMAPAASTSTQQPSQVAVVPPGHKMEPAAPTSTLQEHQLMSKNTMPKYTSKILRRLKPKANATVPKSTGIVDTPWGNSFDNMVVTTRSTWGNPEPALHADAVESVTLAGNA